MRKALHGSVSPTLKESALLSGGEGQRVRLGRALQRKQARLVILDDFDWLYCQMTGFMRTQILAVAASLRLAEHLQEGGRTAEDCGRQHHRAVHGVSLSAGMHEDRSDRLRRWSYVQVHLAFAELYEALSA
jgi:hypothetical protein